MLRLRYRPANGDGRYLGTSIAVAFDEPLGALDALTRISMQKLLERVWLDQRFTAIMVTHGVAEAVTLADRVLMIEDGEIALDLRVDLPRARARLARSGEARRRDPGASLPQFPRRRGCLRRAQAFFAQLRR